MKVRMFLLVVSLLATTYLSSQQIAYIYTDSVLLSMPKYAANISEFENLKQNYQKELEQNKVQLQERFDKLIKPYAKAEKETVAALKMRMTPIDTLSLTALMDESTTIQNKSKSYDNLLKSFYAQDIQPMLDIVRKTISDYAVKNNLTAVYSMEQLRTSLVYIDHKRDITELVIELIRKNN